VQLGQQVGAAREGLHLGPELLEVTPVALRNPVVLPPQEPLHDLLGAHPDQAVDGRHGRVLVDVAQRPGPGQDVKVSGVHEGAIEVEDHAGGTHGYRG
jgi:hypothetical protein